MAKRVILSWVTLIALLVLILGAVYFQTLPSRRASIVVPLLSEFSSKDDFSKITKILGEPDFGNAGGPEGHVYTTEIFELYGKAEIVVQGGTKNVDSITLRTPQGNRVLYPKTSQ